MSTKDTEDFAALLAEYDTPATRRKGPSVGDMVKGTIISIGASAVFVDLGAKSEGMLDLDQVSDGDGKLLVQVGDKIEARVVETADQAGCIVLRRSIARGPDARDELISAHEHGVPVEGVVTAVNKGGFDVQVAGMRGFCPISQIDSKYVESPEQYVGKKFTFQITRLEAGRAKNSVNLVLSRRALLEAEQALRAAALRETLQVGTVVRGTVSTLKDYGAFIDLGGLEGMLHVSEIGFARVSHPSELLAVGQEIEVQIIKIEESAADGRSERISLSLKSMQNDPWQDFAASLKEGQRISGTIIRLQPFGAFVEVKAGVEGLVHISELGAARRINHPREVISEGDRVEVTVLGFDPDKRRLSLSMKGPEQRPDDGEVREEREALQEVNRQAQKGLGTFADLLKGKL